MPECLHCGTSFSSASAEDQFCCHGCGFVHALIRQEGLGRFYDLRDNRPGRPALDRPFQPGEFGWLTARQEAAEAITRDSGSDPSLRLGVHGVSCVGCLWLIEKLFSRHPGAGQADVHPADGRLELTWQTGACDLSSFANTLLRFGYNLTPSQPGGSDRSELRSLTSRLGLCGAFALNAMVFTLPRYLGMRDDFFLAGIFSLITLLSATLALLVGGSYFITRAVGALRRGVLHIDLPIALGIVGAFAGSLLGWFLNAERLLYFDFVAVFTFLMLGGRYLHLAASERVRRNLRAQSPVPTHLTLDDGQSIALEDLQPGTGYSVASGEVVPVDSILRDPAADFSLAWMTGEPTPVTIHAGHRVAAGAVNLNRHALRLRSTQAHSSSLVAALTTNRERDLRSRPLERLLRFYLAAVLLLAITGGTAWAIRGPDPVSALQVFLSILVVSCPCALGVAIPLLDQRAAASLHPLGVFVQTATLWSRLPGVRKLVLDKTGTLTLERPQLLNRDAILTLPSEARTALLTLAASSLHPLSRTLFESLGGDPHGLATVPVEELPGLGMRFSGPTGTWSLGRPGWTGDSHPAHHVPTTALACDLRHNHHLLARFEFVESPRPDARTALTTLRTAFGIDAVLLSGDQPSRVVDLASALGLDPSQAHGGLSPQQKEAAVRALDRHDTLYLGDGANDSLAFDAATATGTPAADRSVLDSKADFFFTAPGLGFLPTLVRTARWRRHTSRQIVAFALTYNLAAISLCLAGLMSPLLAAVLMPLSSLASLALAARPLPLAPLPESALPSPPPATSPTPGVAPPHPSLPASHPAIP